ncbi:MAG: acyl carrier protein [Gammaproteobacteria bacterium]
MTVSYQQINTRVKQRLAEIAEEGSALTDDTDIVNGLGLDSFKVLDLLLDIEDEFNVSIPTNVLVDVHTIKDLCDKIQEILNAAV